MSEPSNSRALIEQGKKCQLITGSFSGRKTPCCDCISVQACKLSKEQRFRLAYMPEIVEVYNQNRRDYEQGDRINTRAD